MSLQLSNAKTTSNTRTSTHKPFTYTERIVKRTIDIIGGLVGVFLFIITYIILCPFYWFQSKEERGPIIYTQTRYGKDGKTFEIYKFRTMIVDSQKYWDTHPEVYEEYRKNGNKLENDPRVTKIGHFIRSKSLDELPQFLNVLKGEMSLVGPRPEVMKFVKQKKEEYKKPVKITLSCQRKQIFTGFLAFILYSLSSVESSGTGEAVRVPKMALPSSVPAFSSFQDAPSFVRWKVAVAVMVA